MELKVITQDSDFYKSHSNDNETYVAVQSSNITELANWKQGQKKTNELFEGFVFISRKGDTCKHARKIVGYASPGLDKAHAMLGYRTMKQLNIKEYDVIQVQPISRLKYLWNHPESSTRSAYRLAVISLWVGILSIFVSIATLII